MKQKIKRLAAAILYGVWALFMPGDFDAYGGKIVNSQCHYVLETSL